MIFCSKWLLQYPLRKYVKTIQNRELKFSSWSSKNQLNTLYSFQHKHSHYYHIQTIGKRSNLNRLTIPITYSLDQTIFLQICCNQSAQKSQTDYLIRSFSSGSGETEKKIKAETENSANNEAKEAEKKLSLLQRFKKMYKEYWYVLVPVHFVTSAFWFSSFYYLAKSGVDIASLLENIGAGETLVHKLRNGHSTMGYIAVSYALYKIATPVRYTVTLGGTTLSIKYLKDWGYIKPIPPRDKLKELLDEKKATLKTRYKEKSFFDRVLTKLRLKKDNEKKC